MKPARSSRTWISGIPSRARTWIAPMAGTPAGSSGMGALSREGLDLDVVVGRVEVDRERSAELAVGGSGRLGRGSMARSAALAELELDHVRGSKQQGVGPGAVAVRDQ